MSAFVKFLQEHRNGSTNDEIGDALRDLVAAVTDEGKAGKLVITIGIKPMGKSDGLEVSCDIKATPPKPTPGVSIFFATPDNELQRNDPRQAAMELREITPGTAHRGVA